MMNPFQMVQMLRNAGNPQQMAINMLRQKGGNSPIVGNAIQMMENNDSKGIENLCRNLCKSNGIDADQMLSQVKSQFGL